MRLVTNSNGSFKGPPYDGIGCHLSHTGFRGLTITDKLYIASSCIKNGGIFCYKQTVRNASGVAGDTCTWNELPERILTNNTDDCWKVHGVTFLGSQACLVLLTFLQRLWKHFPWQKMLFNAWQGRGSKGKQGKQMVVKLSCNSRLQCVQNLTLYAFVVQLLVGWEWAG